MSQVTYSDNVMLVAEGFTRGVSLSSAGKRNLFEMGELKSQDDR